MVFIGDIPRIGISLPGSSCRRVANVRLMASAPQANSRPHEFGSHLHPNTAPSGSHTASPGAGNAAMRLSLIPPKWTNDTAPRRPLPMWRERLVCSHCGSHDTDMVVTGERRRKEATAGAPEGCSVGLADCFGQDGLTRRNPGRGRSGVSRRDYRHCASSTFGTVRMKRSIGIRACASVSTTVQSPTRSPLVPR
jgi:hypothetical protein